MPYSAAQNQVFKTPDHPVDRRSLQDIMLQGKFIVFHFSDHPKLVKLDPNPNLSIGFNKIKNFMQSPDKDHDHGNFNILHGNS